MINVDETALFFFFLFKIDFCLFLDRRREGEREGEKRQCVGASCTALLGTWPTTQACSMTGNRTGDQLVRRSVQDLLSHTSQDETALLKTHVGLNPPRSNLKPGFLWSRERPLTAADH